jgi:hypothetical protein
MNSLILVTTASVLFGWNPAPPPPVAEREAPKENRVKAPVIIKSEALAGEEKSVKAKIVIPKALLHTLGARGTARPAAGARPESREQGSLPIGTVIAGLALSLAAVSAVFVFRGNRTTKTAALAMLAGAVVLGALGVAEADLAVPGSAEARRKAPPPQDIVIELSDDVETVTLILAK